MTSHRRMFLSILAISAVSAVSADAAAQDARNRGARDREAPTEGRTAVAILSPAQGWAASGTVTFFELPGEGVLIAAEVRDLEPGEHGISIHARGDCSAPDLRSAGPHFNPDDGHHGPPSATYSHAGDLGNLEADEEGVAYFSYRAEDLSFEGANSILNRSIVVREKGDDYLSQPDGQAGARIACGVIVLSEPASELAPGPRQPVARR